MTRLIGLAACTLALAACKHPVIDPEQPALISNPTDASRAALQRTVDAAMHTEVLLAPDALTESSLLIIEHESPRSIGGPPAGGRSMTAPVQFRLVTNGSDCVLVDQRDRSRHVLADTSCRVEASPPGN